MLLQRALQYLKLVQAKADMITRVLKLFDNEFLCKLSE